MRLSPAGRVLDWFEARLNLTELFSFLTSFGLFIVELDTRKPIREALPEALKRPIPSYARWPRVLGILTLLIFLFQVSSGLLLAFYYRPATPGAYESVRTIVRDVSLGWFIHQMHFWGSSALILILLARILRHYFDGLYRAPRELLWVLSFLLFIAATHADFSGRILTWESTTYWSTTRALELFSLLPFVGTAFAFLVGGSNIGDAALTRFYFIHIVFLPLALLALFYLHFLVVRRVGLSPAPGEAAQQGILAYKRYLLNLLIVLVLVFGLLVTLSVLFPLPFDKKADVLTTPAGALPPWYLLPAFGFVTLTPHFIPNPIKGTIVLLTLVAVTLLPFLDRPAAQSPTGRLGRLVAGLFFLLLLIGLGLYGYSHA
ncbi:MAG: cytochrome b N-terminal domain-containing protein [Acidobacteriota bacterium]